MKRIAAAGQDDNAVIGVGADRVKQVDKLFMGMPIEHQSVAIGVKRHFQHSTFRAGDLGMSECILVGS
jgi:hypothetical protein